MSVCKNVSVLMLGFMVFCGYCGCTKKAELTEAEQEQLDQRQITSYLTAKNLTGFKRDSTTQSTSKLWYKIIDTTTADSPVVSTSSLVFVRYKGRLLNGTVFDEKIDTAGFRLSSTIQGWQIGLNTYLKKKGQIRLIIPSKVAYGKYEQPGVPPNSVVDYEIKLDSIGN